MAQMKTNPLDFKDKRLTEVHSEMALSHADWVDIMNPSLVKGRLKALVAEKCAV